jgi:hypothetical protein
VSFESVNKRSIYVVQQTSCLVGEFSGRVLLHGVTKLIIQSLNHSVMFTEKSLEQEKPA